MSPAPRPDLRQSDELTIVPANQASWEDIQAVFGMRGYTASCQCQWFKTGRSAWVVGGRDERAFQLRVQTDAGHPESDTTSGLIAYLDGEPVGWCAVESRTAYPRLLPRRVMLAERGEDPDDESVWAVTCFVTRAGFRRRGLMYPLARAAVDFARDRGARALEAYPMITTAGEEITWGELHVGSRTVFEAAGMTEVARATLRRVVMRIDFDQRT
jgi:GNAT superfamily N-acetyltransferase